MKTAVIYARYSSENQTEQSIEGQLRVCQDYAQKHDILILDSYIDRAMTGTNDNRPAFLKMIKDSERKEWNYVLVYKLDRFSRNKYETTIHKHTLKENGVKLLSAMENIPDTPEGIILESLLEGMNQYYSAELAQKVHRGLNESYIKGNYTGGYLPYGYQVENKKCVIDDEEAVIVKEIFARYAQGYTVVAIASELKTRGVRTKTGKKLNEKTIYKMLVNIKYSGKVIHDGKTFDNIIPRIVPEDIWKKVQDICAENKHAPGRKKDIYDYILSGKLICGKCKARMVGESGTSETGTIHYYYSCLTRRRKKLPCDLKSVGKKYLEDTVINTTWKMLSDTNVIDRIADSVYKLHAKESADNTNLKAMESEKATMLKAANNLIAAVEQGIVTEQTKARLKELETLISGLEFDIEREKQKSYTYLTVNIIKEYLNSIIKGDTEDIEVRKCIVKTFVREVILYEDKIVITYNFCETSERHKITQETTLEVERQSETAASSSVSGSYKGDFPQAHP